MKLRLKYLLGIGLMAVTVNAQTTPPKPASRSVKEMSDHATELSDQVSRDGKQVRHLQAQARKQKDVIKLGCVNDKLVQLKAQENLFDDSEKQFQDALVESRADAAGTALADLDKTSHEIANLRSEAEACVGVPELYKQESATSVDAPTFPDDPTGSDPFAPEVETPGYASPYN